jgi:hypothetical protein
MEIRTKNCHAVRISAPRAHGANPGLLTQSTSENWTPKTGPFNEPDYFWGSGKKGGMTENQDIGNGHIGILIPLAAIRFPIYPFLICPFIVMDISEMDLSEIRYTV